MSRSATAQARETSTLIVQTREDIERHLVTIQANAAATCSWLRGNGEAEVMKSLKFDSVGRHPITGNSLNLIEQVNQTWTYIAALQAARVLLRKHPDCGGLRLAPGAHAATDCDIVSTRDGLIGAEVFAAVTPGNNRKLRRDVAKMREKSGLYAERYVFYLSPVDPNEDEQWTEDGIRIWSLDYLAACACLRDS